MDPVRPTGSCRAQRFMAAAGLAYARGDRRRSASTRSKGGGAAFFRPGRTVPESRAAGSSTHLHTERNTTGEKKTGADATPCGVARHPHRPVSIYLVSRIDACTTVFGQGNSENVCDTISTLICAASACLQFPCLIQRAQIHAYAPRDQKVKRATTHAFARVQTRYRRSDNFLWCVTVVWQMTD